MKLVIQEEDLSETTYFRDKINGAPLPDIFTFVPYPYRKWYANGNSQAR
jgi:hypothetical protein